VPEGTPAFRVLERFRENRIHIALVIDEHGGLQGLVTTSDILEAIAGEIPLKGKPLQPQAVQRPDGSWLLDGLLSVDKLKKVLEIHDLLPGETKGHYQTLGGFVLTSLGHIPAASDRFDWRHFRFEVMDMDGHRVDKVLVFRVPKGSPERNDQHQNLQQQAS
jgi:putative hemolysin